MSSMSSSSSSIASRRSRSLKCTAVKSIKPTCENESIDVPTCFCGVDASLRISWTEKNPGRRFFNCGNSRAGQCAFFQWFDRSPGIWFNSTLVKLLERIDHLEGLLENEKLDSSRLLQTPKVTMDLKQCNVSNDKYKVVSLIFLVIFLIIGLLYQTVM